MFSWITWATAVALFLFTVPELVEGLVIPELLFVGMVEDKKKYQI